MAVVVAMAAITLAVVALVWPRHSSGQAFPRLLPAAGPAGWRQLTLPGGKAVLSYPSSLVRISSDRDAVSVGQVSTAGAIQLYLNATPRQAAETLRHWASFRLRLLRTDDAVFAREVAAARRVRFRGGTGSCVIDTYVTRIGGHHFQELACLVQGRSSASVIIGAAPAARWARARPLLLRAVAAYQVR